MKITICICFKRNIAESGNILDTYWTIRKFTFNLFVLILVDLQEVVDLDTRRKKKKDKPVQWKVSNNTRFVHVLLLHNREIWDGAKFELLVQRENNRAVCCMT